MKYGSLFSGIGGFDLGFEQAGLSCSWQVEIDTDCHRVLEKHWPGVTRYKDVKDVGRLEPVDVICGGFPCQDLSVAGKRAGLAGERSGLWFEFLRIIGLNRPRWIVIENVPGLLSSDEGRDFAVILRGLVECGYCLAWRISDAQFYGVAQRRRRVFIVGSLGDGSCAEILFESEGVSGNPPTRGEAGQTVAPTVRGGTASGSNEFGNKLAATLKQRGRGACDEVMDNLQVCGAVSSKWAKGTGGPAGDEAYNLVTHALRSEGADASEDGTGRGTPLIVAFEPHHDEHEGRGVNFKQAETNPALRGPNGTDNTLIAFSSKDHGADAGEIAPTLRSQNFKDSHMNGGGQVAIAFDTTQITSKGNYSNPKGGDPCHPLAEGAHAPAIAFTERGREGGANLETQDELSYALRDPQKGMNSRNAVAGNFGVRRLTPRECERLQSFPDDFTRWDASGKEISDSARYRMLGNAVCVNVARWIGKRILETANGKT